MVNNKFFIALFMGLICIACENKDKTSYSEEKSSIKLDYEKVSGRIEIKGNKSLDRINISVKDIENKEILIPSSKTFNIKDLLRKFNNINNIALMAAKNNGQIDLKIKAGTQLDTIISFKFPNLNLNLNLSNSTIKGKMAKIYKKNSGDDFKVSQKKWLYKNNENLSDSILNDFLDYSSFLLQSGKNEYEIHDVIPVVKSFTGETYTIQSDMKADHYVLFAASDQKEIDDFIEEIISTDYELTSQSLGRMPCYRNLDKSGYKCIFLIGINKDWKIQQEPLGVIGIDNLAPLVTKSYRSSSYGLDKDLSSNKISGSQTLSFSETNTFIQLPKQIEALEGALLIDTGDFRGDDAQFIISWDGDIKSISIKREIHRDYQRYFMKPETKTINLTEKSSPYKFVYKLDLGIGDNFIPITVTDKRGNTTEYSLNIPMERVKNDGINIDNNINIYN